MSEIEEVLISNESIRLGQFLKLTNLVENGVQARELIQDGQVLVNGKICRQRGKQLVPGDTVGLGGLIVRCCRAENIGK